MPFNQLHNQFPHIVQGLCQTRKRGKIGHAWIFSGDHLGTLKDFARSWMQSCICTQSTPTGDACGSCTNCSLFKNENYSNLRTLAPISKSRHILVDEIRELEHFLHLRTGGDLKIGFILEADRMFEQVQNAFLKTLEEPPNDSMLLLVTTNLQGLLPTIRSRCQIVSIMKNRIDYDFDGLNHLIGALSTMKRGKGAWVAVTATNAITTLLEKMEMEAESEGKKEKKKLEASPFSENKSFKSSAEASIDASTKSRYLAVRESVVSVIHTWFAQEYIRSFNVPTSILTNKEFYDQLPSVSIPEISSVNDALRNLKFTEELIDRLQFNVDEQLAIKDFCLKICSKS